MKFPLSSSSRSFATLLVAFLCLLPLLAHGQTLNITNDTQRLATLTNTTVTLTGKSELHIAGAGDPISGCTIHLNSPDSWFFMTAKRPSEVNSTFLSRVRVNGAVAVLDGNVRVVQFELGAVVIPHGPDFAPMEVFDGRQFAGTSKPLRSYLNYNDTSLGALKMAISSFRLKRGYAATVAQQENGSGLSKVYVAQDGDLEVGALPVDLDNNIRFVRIFPWRWVSKKGFAGTIGQNLRPLWYYNWNIDQTSSLDVEYVPIRHTEWWPGLDQDWKYRGATHLLGFNEPDHANQANMSVATAIARWPDLLATGLRVGAPAITDGGSAWLYSFIDQADAAGLRVDFVPVHYYRSYSNPADPDGAATQFYNFLKTIYDRVKRPLWVTEFNNGANWTGDPDPTYAQQRATVEKMIEMLDNAPFVERYCIYNWVEDVRRVVWDDGSPTDAGVSYRDNASPNAYLQELPDAGLSSMAHYVFDNDLRDSTGNGNDGTAVGPITYVAGRSGQAANFDGTDAYVQLSRRLGDSTDFTFGAWVYWNGGGNWQRIFDLGNGTNNYLCLIPKAGNGNLGLRFAIKNGGDEQQLNHTAALPVGVWTHVALTITGTTGKLFVNGALVNTNTGLNIDPGAVGTRFNYLGKSQFILDPLFNGRIDDARFISSALTDAQVATMASGTPPQFSTDPVVKTGAQKLQPFTGSIVTSATGTGTLTFSKLSGPAWLAVASNGQLTGVPGLADGGLNRFRIRVTDSGGKIDTANLHVTVADVLGLVTRYAFEGTANATVGNAHGATSGSPAYNTGRYGSAIDLDGADDFVRLPQGVASHPEITIATWVYWDGGNNWQRVFDFGNGTGEFLFLSPKTGNNVMRFEIKNNGGAQSLETSPLATGQWVHLAVTLGANTGRLYVNGSLVDTDTVTIKPTDFEPVSNFLGKSQFPDPAFNGRIDEFLVFNHALTGAQVLALVTGRAPAFTFDPTTRPNAPIGVDYDQTIAGAATDPDAGSALAYSKAGGPVWLTVEPSGRISGVPSTADIGTNRFVVRVTDGTKLADDTTLTIVVPGASDLLAHYQLDGNTINSAGGTAGVATGGPVYDAGIFDRAMRFDGTDDFVTLPSGMLNGVADVTFAARVRWNGGGNWQRIFDFGNNTTQYMLLTPRSASGTLRFTATVSGNGAGNEQFIETPALVIGEWTHVAVTLIGNTGSLYVNGAAVASGTISIDPAAFSPTKNYLGKAQFADPLFNGLIDDVRIYQRGLSAAEVQSLAVPLPPVIVQTPDYSFAGWAAGIPFPVGQGDANDDPDGDGLVNGWEYLFGRDPLVGNMSDLPQPVIRTAAQLGGTTQAGKTYLSIQARIRKNRSGVTLVPEAAPSIEALGLPEAATHAKQAGAPAPDGDFEIFTYYYDVATQDLPGGAGFIRVRSEIE